MLTMTSNLPTPIVNYANKLKEYFIFFPDFPKKGILFWDVFALYKNPEASKLLNDIFRCFAEFKKGTADVVVGIEARGFLFGPLLAELMGVPFVPIRKKGKLPGTVKQKSYGLEYGADTIEIQIGIIKAGQRAMIVDDCIATGGTLKATCELIEEVGGVISDCVVIYTIPGINGNWNLSVPLTSFCS